ncbi:unnamed protein product, partial [Meganyctiphanes norvegica]
MSEPTDTHINTQRKRRWIRRNWKRRRKRRAVPKAWRGDVFNLVFLGANLCKLEASETCKWLRAAGFPQYAQMYEECDQFPVELQSVERDHSFLDSDSLQALFRRIKVLNQCAKIRHNNLAPTNADDAKKYVVAIIPTFFHDNSKFYLTILVIQILKFWTQRMMNNNVHYLKIGNFNISLEGGHFIVGGGGGSLIFTLIRIIIYPSEIIKQILSFHGSVDCYGVFSFMVSLVVQCLKRVLDAHPSRSEAKKLNNLSLQDKDDDITIGNFKRTGSERLKSHAKAFLRRMESLKNKKKRKRKMTISEPKLADDFVQTYMRNNLYLSSHPMLSMFAGTNICTTLRSISISIPACLSPCAAEDSSSLASEQSYTSTPISQVRRRRKFWPSQSYAEGDCGAYSDSECSPCTWRVSYDSSFTADANGNSFKKLSLYEKSYTGASDKRIYTDGCGHKPKYGHRLTKGTTLKEKMTGKKTNINCSSHKEIDRRKNTESPLHSPIEERRSIYDNVPLVICNKSYQEYSSDNLDSDAGAQVGSSSECTIESQDSLLHDNNLQVPRRRATVDRWHSFNKKSITPPIRQSGTQINHFSAGQMLHLRKRALLRLTALMERYCPSNRSGWNWELPKFIRKMKSKDYSDRQLFGVPLVAIAQRTAQPMPSGIQDALNHLRTTCLHQIGLFRKPGVRSRIQKLKELHENREDIDYSNFGSFDVADMVKTYFRELPEVLLTNKLSEMFITIFQYLPEDRRLEALQCSILLLPDENREVLLALLTFLSDVAANSHLNQGREGAAVWCLNITVLSVGISSSLPSSLGYHLTKDQDRGRMSRVPFDIMNVIIPKKLGGIIHNEEKSYLLSFLEGIGEYSLETVWVLKKPQLNHEGYESETAWVNTYLLVRLVPMLIAQKHKRYRRACIKHINTHFPAVFTSGLGYMDTDQLWGTAAAAAAPDTRDLDRIISERSVTDQKLLAIKLILTINESLMGYISSSIMRPLLEYCVHRCGKEDVIKGVPIAMKKNVSEKSMSIFTGVRKFELCSRFVHLLKTTKEGKIKDLITRADIKYLTSELHNMIPEWFKK